MAVASNSVISAVGNGKSANIKSDESRISYTRDAKQDKEVLDEVPPCDWSIDRQFLGKPSGPRRAWSESILTQDLLFYYLELGTRALAKIFCAWEIASDAWGSMCMIRPVSDICNRRPSLVEAHHTRNSIADYHLVLSG